MRVASRGKEDSYLLLIVEESASRVGFYDPTRGQCIASIETGFLPHEIEVSADGRTAYVSNFGLQDYDGTPEQFASAYYQRYNMAASYLSAGAVACGLTFEDAIQRAGTIERAAVRDALADTHLSTFFGGIEFHARGMNERKPLITFQVQQTANGLTNAVLAPDAIAGSAKVVWPFPGWGKQGP